MKRALLAAAAGALAFAVIVGGGLFALSKEAPGPVSFAGASSAAVEILEGETRVAELSLGSQGPMLAVLRQGEAAQAAQKAADALKTRATLTVLMEEGGTAAFVEVGPSDPRYPHAVVSLLKSSYGLDARAP